MAWPDVTGVAIFFEVLISVFAIVITWSLIKLFNFQIEKAGSGSKITLSTVLLFIFITFSILADLYFAYAIFQINSGAGLW